MNQIVNRFFLVLVFAALLLSACNFSVSGLFSPATTGLTFERAVDGSISGSYKYPKEEGKVTVNFSVSADGLAGFWLDKKGTEDILTVDLRNGESSSMNWRGVALDGLGPLNSEELAVLNELLLCDLAYGLGLIPLDIACQAEGMVNPIQAAALLFPLQMRFKYQITDRAAVASTLGYMSKCQYTETAEAVDVNPSLIMMSPSAPVPVVFGYFPLDAEGAVEKPTGSSSGMKLAAQDGNWWDSDFNEKMFPDLTPFGPDPIQDEWGPCEAKCRGACGPDCTHNNCKFHIDDRCEKNQEGNNDGYRSFYYVYECGLHPACIEHDACYDECNRSYGCETFLSAFCMHGMTGVSMPLEYFSETYLSCDSQVLVTEGLSKAKDWMRGYGPFTAYQVFEYSDPENRFEYDLAHCPLAEDAPPEESVHQPEEQAPPDEPDPVQPSEDDASPESPEVLSTIPVGTYVGTIEYSDEFMTYAESFTSEVSIIVAANGVVSGAFTGQIVDEPYSYEYTYQWVTDFSGTFSGTLAEYTGVIESAESMMFTPITNDPQEFETASGTYTRLVEITIADNILTGITQPRPDYPDEMFILKFVATKND